MNYKLSEGTKLALREHHKKERDGRVRDRIKAVLLHDKGWTYQEIAEALLLSHEAIRQHINDYYSDQKLKPENGGSESKLTSHQLEALEKHLEINNYIYLKDIVGYVEKQYGVSYTCNGMRNVMQRLGFIYKKPKLVPGKIDLQKQEEFRYQYDLLKRSITEKEAVYFMDSVHPQYQTRARCGWIKKNQVKTLPTFSGWKRKHIIGVIELKGMNVIKLERNKINGESIVEFLREVEAKNPNKTKIYIICDNAGYHKGKLVKEYLQTSRIELIFLPTYSPNLNPIERLWKFMHKIVTNNKWYENFTKFSEAIDAFFDKIPKYKQSLQSLINDNFQKLKVDHFVNSSI